MSKLKVVLLATMIAWAGFGSSQAATAAQVTTPAMTATTHLHPVVTEARSRSVSGREYIALARKCTLKRYRRPR